MAWNPRDEGIMNFVYYTMSFEFISKFALKSNVANYLIFYLWHATNSKLDCHQEYFLATEEYSCILKSEMRRLTLDDDKYHCHVGK